MEHITLFTDIMPEEQERIRVSEWRDDHGVLQFHEKDRFDSGRPCCPVLLR